MWEEYILLKYIEENKYIYIKNLKLMEIFYVHGEKQPSS